MKKTKRLDPTSRIPLYYQLVQIIKDHIKDGRLNPGEKLWSEEELINMYGISRTSVRRAVQELVNEGLLITKRGKRSCIAKPKITRGFPGLTSFSEDMNKRGLKAGSKILGFHVMTPTREIGQNLNLDGEEKIVQLKRLMLANDEPIGFHIVYLPLNVWSQLGIDASYLNNQSLYRTLEEKGGFLLSEADETIEVGFADSETGKALSIEKGTPILVMHRLVYAADGKYIEYAINIYRADRYSYEIHHRRDRTSK